MKIPQLRSRKPVNPALSRDLLAVTTLIDDRAVTSALVDEEARILHERRSEIAQPAVRTVAAQVAQLMIQTVSEYDLRGRKIAAAGVAFDGFVDPVDERVTLRGPSGKSDGSIWLRAAFKDALVLAMEKAQAKRTFSGHPGLKLSSKLAACIVGEVWAGAARGARHAVYVSIDEEIAAGIIADGRVLGGAHGRAGSAGWLPLSETYRDEFREKGALSVEGGSRAIVRRTIEAWNDQRSSVVSRLSVSDPSGLTPELVIRAARGGDPLAQKVITDLSGWIGRGVSSLISVLNPEVVVIGGRLGRALKPYLGAIRLEARKWAEPGSGRSCRIVGASAGEKCALIGAARLAFESERANRAQ